MVKRGVIVFFLFILALPAFALTLKESLDLAVKNNPSVISAQKKVDASQAKLYQAAGAFLPTVKLEGSLGRNYSQPSTVRLNNVNISFGIDAIADTKSISTSLSQPIFVAGLFPGFSIAQKSLDLAREDLRKTVLEINFTVTQTYFGVLKAENLVELSKQSLKTAISHQKQVRSMLQVGSASYADLLRTQVQEANSEVVLIKAKNGLEIAKNAFNNCLGRPLDQTVEISDRNFPQTAETLPDYDSLLQSADKFRPEWKQFLLSKKMAEDNLTVAKTAYLPTVMASAQSGNQIIDYPSFYKTDVNSWSITGAASWTLFDGFGIQNRIREAAANLDSQKAIENQIKNKIALEVRNAYFDLKSAAETIKSSKKALDSAEENYKVSDFRYQSGAGTNLEIIDAQVALFQAEINYYEALYDLVIAKVKINMAIGREVI